MAYIGSDNELPLIEWKNENESPLCVNVLNLEYYDDKFANENLTMKHRYCVGSWQGCGCGFSFDFDDEHYEAEDNIRGKQSVEALFDYIRVNVTNDSCELLSFWSGEGIEHDSDILDLKDFVLGNSFDFLEGQYMTVTK